MNLVWFAIAGYLCGSIPFGLLLTRWAGLGDVRNIGSGNIGATNVLRTGNKKVAALTLLCDGLKGFLPVYAASFADTPHAAVVSGLGAVAGHVFPLWLKFKGGKGVATGLGVLFGWQWMLGLLFCAVWLAVFKLRKISSLAALSAYGLVAMAAFVLANFTSIGVLPLLPWAVLAVAVAVYITHRANIQRLFKGEEPTSSLRPSP